MSIQILNETIKSLRSAYAHKQQMLQSTSTEDRKTISSLSPPDVEDRHFPGHLEGDLIKGEGNATAVGTLVELTNRLLMLFKMQYLKPASAANVLQSFTEKLCVIAQPMRKMLISDQDK